MAQLRARTLDGRLIGLSAGDSQDVEAYGLLPRHLDLVLGAIVTALVLRGARLAYGGDLRQRGFTQQLYENVAEAYADDYLQGEGSGAPPFVHYLAASVWTSVPAEQLEAWLTAGAGLIEVRFMTDDGYLAVFARDEKFLIQRNPEQPDGAEHKLSSAPEVMLQLRNSTLKDRMPIASLAYMRKSMGRDCDARVLLGGRMFGYAGDEPGIGAEARESLVQNSIVLPLGGFGGAARDVAKQLRLCPEDIDRLREGALPQGPGYRKVMDEIAIHALPMRERLGGRIERARQLAMTTDVKDAARLVVDILETLPKRSALAR